MKRKKSLKKSYKKKKKKSHKKKIKRSFKRKMKRSHKRKRSLKKLWCSMPAKSPSTIRRKSTLITLIEQISLTDYLPKKLILLKPLGTPLTSNTPWIKLSLFTVFCLLILSKITKESSSSCGKSKESNIFWNKFGSFTKKNTRRHKRTKDLFSSQDYFILAISSEPTCPILLTHFTAI